LPAVQAGPLPHLHLPAAQALAVVAEQATQAPASAPQLVSVVPARHAAPEQQPAQLALLQPEQLPATHAAAPQFWHAAPPVPQAPASVPA